MQGGDLAIAPLTQPSYWCPIQCSRKTSLGGRLHDSLLFLQSLQFWDSLLKPHQNWAWTCALEGQSRLLFLDSCLQQGFSCKILAEDVIANYPKWFSHYLESESLRQTKFLASTSLLDFYIVCSKYFLSGSTDLWICAYSFLSICSIVVTQDSYSIGD